MNTLDAILTRRSCREFTDKPIKSETCTSCWKRP